MNALERSLIEKAGYSNGFEHVIESISTQVVLGSARHRSQVFIAPRDDGDAAWRLQFANGPSIVELNRSFPGQESTGGFFEAVGESELWRLLRRAAELAMSLPTHTEDCYTEACAKLDLSPPPSTEALRLTKQRIGQDLFRQALMEYWGGACAVTGIAVPELLQSSHAKPWAKCASDAERLNVFNGLLLCAHLDALFDRGLMTFSSQGTAVFSRRVDAPTLDRLGLRGGLQLRWVADEHRSFLEWHRSNVFEIS